MMSPRQAFFPRPILWRFDAEITSSKHFHLQFREHDEAKAKCTLQPRKQRKRTSQKTFGIATAKPKNLSQIFHPLPSLPPSPPVLSDLGKCERLGRRHLSASSDTRRWLRRRGPPLRPWHRDSPHEGKHTRATLEPPLDRGAPPPFTLPQLSEE